MSGKEYKCACCGETFLTDDFTDEEKLAELNKNYPGFTTEECALVCDDCYNIPFLKNLRGPKRERKLK